MDNKIYEAPQSEIVEIDSEGIFCESPVPGSGTEQYGPGNPIPWM